MPQNVPETARRKDLGILRAGSAPKPSQPSPPEPDPAYLLLMCYDRNHPWKFNWTTKRSEGDYIPGTEQVAAKALGGNPTIFFLSGQNEGALAAGVLIQQIERHVKTRGTLKVLRISGHGHTNHIGMGPHIDTRQFLGAVRNLQHLLGTKVADRIELDGCDIFAGLSDRDVATYKNLASELGADIVGPTSFVEGMDDSGRFVAFAPDGVVKRDRRDCPIETWILHKALTLSGSRAWKEDNVAQNEAWLVRELARGPLADKTQGTKTTTPGDGTDINEDAIMKSMPSEMKRELKTNFTSDLHRKDARTRKTVKESTKARSLRPE